MELKRGLDILAPECGQGKFKIIVTNEDQLGNQMWHLV